MAEQDDNKKQTATEAQAEAKNGTKGKVVPWCITGVVIIALAGLGFFAGRLFGTRGNAQTASAGEKAKPTDQPPPTNTGAPGDPAASDWYYDLDPVVANLNEPGGTRYVRVGLTLEINAALNQETTTAMLDQKKPLLKHWLNLYLSNQTAEDARGEKNLRRMQTQISDALNQGLFPDAAPQIKRVLFKELSIQ